MGDIQETLLQKVNQQSRDVRELFSEIKDLKKLIIGNGEVGLAETVRNNERFVGNASKLMWIMVGQTIAFVSLLVTVVIALLK